MASKEAIKLNKSDIGEADTIEQPGSPTFTNVQTSSLDQPEVVRRSAFSPWNTSYVPGPCDVTSSSDVVRPEASDSTMIPLITSQSITSSEEPDYAPGNRLSTAPWTLRRTSLLGLIAFVVALIIVLEVLHFLSNKNQGLITSTQNTSYLWKYLPTAVLTALAIYWNKLDYHTRALMPWKLISEKPQSAAKSLLLDYVSGNLFVVFSGSIRSRHLPVVTSTLGSLTIILITVFSTGLFVLQPTSLLEETTISVLSTFDGSRFNSSEVDSFPVLAVASILSGNLSIAYPPGTDADYAVDYMSLQSSLNGSGVSKSGVVEAFQAELSCKVASANLTSVEVDWYAWTIEVDIMADGCSTGPNVIARPAASLREERQLLSLGKVIITQCPGANQPKAFVFFGQLDLNAVYTKTGTPPRQINIYAFNSSALVCTPDHVFQEALVTTDSTGGVIETEFQHGSTRSIVSPWDIWAAVNTSLLSANPTFLVHPHEYTHGTSTYDEFMAVVMATWSRRPVEYLDPKTLMQDLQRFFTTAAGQIADRHLRANSTNVIMGTYRKTQLRVILPDTVLRVTEAGLAVLVICACLLVVSPPCPPSSSTGTSLGSLAVMIRGSDQLKTCLHGMGEMPLDKIKDCLSDRKFSLNSHGSGKPHSIELHQCEDALQSDSTPTVRTITWFRPVAFSIYMRITVMALPLVIVACLEATYQFSRRQHGLADAPANRYMHYAWTWIPASLMTLISLLYASVTWSVALLDPYSILRTRSVASEYALCQVNLSKTPIQIAHRGLRLKRYALLATGVSALLAPLLTIIVSGLIFLQPVQKTENLVVPLADHISSPAGQQHTFHEWSQASLWAAGLLYHGYGSYPRGTYRNFIFPNMKHSADNVTLPVDRKLLNATSVDMDVGIIMSNITCRVLDSAGFRYTVGFNGSNDPAKTTSDGVWYGGAAGNSFLNLSHPDLAAYRCSSPGLHCETGIVSFGIELEANSTRFSFQLDQDYLNVMPWAEPSSWPNGDSLREAIALRNETDYVRPNIFSFYGTWNATTAHITGMECYYDIRQGRANITYDLSTQLVTAVLPVGNPLPAVSDFSDSLPWSGAGQESINALLPQTDFWQTALDSTPEAFYDTPSGSAQLATQVSDLYNHYFTQFYNTALRSNNFTADTTHANATLYDENWQRVYQSAISTRILEALLLAMWCCACIAFWTFDTKKLLPKNPCSIAAQVSLLADAKFLDMISEGAGMATVGELMEMTPFKDHLFSMGWWDDENGGRRFGIDVGMADFDKGGNVEIEEKKSSGDETDEAGSTEIALGKVDNRVSVDIVSLER